VERRHIRIILDLSENELADKITLPNDEAHHVKTVLRAKEGALIEVISRTTQKTYEAVIQSTENGVNIKIIREKLSQYPQSKVSVMHFALCKGDTNDWVLEKCCELAAGNVIIWQADHSVAKLKTEEDIQKKLTRWNKICEAASKQSGNPRTTKAFFAKDLRAALKISQSIDSLPKTLICCSTSPEALPVSKLNFSHTTAAIVIGPEGDFSKNEISLMQQEGFQFATLGPYILRAETAALSVLSAINSVYGYNN
jgi:16S rRNA (uracil1498-N3)-methyltransferase